MVSVSDAVTAATAPTVVAEFLMKSRRVDFEPDSDELASEESRFDSDIEKMDPEKVEEKLGLRKCSVRPPV